MYLRSDCHKLFEGVKLFPIEVELEKTAFQYNSTGSFTQVYLPSDTARQAVLPRYTCLPVQ
jgi:hypothetical protein